MHHLTRRHLLLAATLIPTTVVALNLGFVLVEGWLIHQLHWGVLYEALLWWLSGWESAMFPLTALALATTATLWLVYLIDVGRRPALAGSQRAVGAAVVLIVPVPGMLADCLPNAKTS